MFKYFLYKLGLLLLKCLPTPICYKLAYFISDIQFCCSFRDRRAVTNNLKSILETNNDVSVHTREVFRNFGKYLIEFFQMREMVDDHFIKSKVHIEGTHHLDNALANGKGGIIVTAHIGNWELGAVLLSVLGYPLMAVALPHKERPVNDLFNQQREAKGVEVVPTNTALRRCVEQLKTNKFVALVADRGFHANGIVMDFLGRKALIPKGAAMFSWKSGAPIIPVFLIRNDTGKFTLICHEPIDPPKRDVSIDEDAVILGIMKRYVAVIEEQIRTNPSQWLLFREYSRQ